MKVVIFAGGLGTRMREETEFKPKPMIEIGGRPVLWHIMKGFAFHGHTDFVICAGYKSHLIKDYFFNYALYARDFTTKLGDRDSTVFHGEHQEAKWTVTVADTGLDTQTGGRLARVRAHLGEDTFLCTYGDGVAPVDINSLLQRHYRHGRPATMTVARQANRFGVVELGADGAVTSFKEKPKTNDLINIGFFVFGPEIFRGLQNQTVLEREPLQALASAGKLTAHEHDGFWEPMDTYREFQHLNNLWEQGEAPWKIW